METAARYETKVILRDIRREGWQWREYVERRVGVEKVSWSPNKPPFSAVDMFVSDYFVAWLLRLNKLPSLLKMSFKAHQEGKMFQDFLKSNACIMYLFLRPT
jgi:hypothetical protein